MGVFRAPVRSLHDMLLAEAEAVAAFPSLAQAPTEFAALNQWFDTGGCSEAACHAAAFILESFGATDIAFNEQEALHVWDAAHRVASRGPEGRAAVAISWRSLLPRERPGARHAQRRDAERARAVRRATAATFQPEGDTLSVIPSEPPSSATCCRSATL